MKRATKRTKSKTFLGLHIRTFVVSAVIFGFYLGIVSLASLYQAATKVATNNQYLEIYSHFIHPNKQQTTLLLFQNNAELRYGGGFIGSVGVLNSGPGGYKLQPIRSVYYYDHRIDDRPSITPVPPEMIGFIDRMHLRDSGIYLDWSKSAELAAQYFEIESGQKVDNVVAITPTTFKKLLATTGPVELKEYGITVTEDNFLTEVQLEVESGEDKQNKKDPKTILGTLGNQVIQKLLEKKIADLSQTTKILEEMIQQKQFMLYSRDKAIQAKLEANDMAGRLSDFSGNSILVGEANIGANKSSPFIRQEIDQELSIGSAGEATVNLRIRRTHTSDYQHQYLDPADNVTRWLVAQNVDKVKMYLPRGSKLIDSSLGAGQLSVRDEEGRTSVNYQNILAPLQNNEVTFRYTLPFKYALQDNKLSLTSLFEKQAGGFDQQIKFRVKLPKEYRLLLSSERELGQVAGDTNNTYQVGFIQQKNQVVSLVFERSN